MLRIQINASRHPRERPGRSENGTQKKLRLSAQMPAVFCARCQYEAFFTHGVIPGSSHTQALGISSPGIDEVHLMGPCNDGEPQWNIMSDWMYR